MSININDVRIALRELPNTLAGPDGIPATVYKQMAHILAAPLLHIFQQSLHQGKLPRAWKLARVIPLYEGKSVKEKASTYRQIGLTNVAGKILERIIARHLNEFLDSNKIISKSQHGERRGRSTVTNLLSCESCIVEMVNNSISCDVITIDFMRAFDKVCHKHLYDKIKALGIDGCYLSWIADFLNNRLQFVSYDGASSITTAVPSGTIQSSAIGGTLFTIFINDLCGAIKHCDKWLFVDDLKLAGDASTPEKCALIQYDLDAINEWSERNQMPISIPKCAMLHYGLHSLSHQHSIGMQYIIAADNCMDLGILRNTSLSYDNHGRNVALKCNRLVGMFMKAFNTRSPDFLVQIFPCTCILSSNTHRLFGHRQVLLCVGC